jgi:hypothetical protein
MSPEIQAKLVQKQSPISRQIGLLQRQCACGQHAIGGECERCREKKGILQRAAVGPAPNTVPAMVHEVLRSPGQPIDLAARAFMEPRFGHDFSQVRVHTDAMAAESARAVKAQAYSVGHRLVFDTGQYTPGTLAGKKLLAHELTHVVQQEGKPRTVKRKKKPTAPGVQPALQIVIVEIGLSRLNDIALRAIQQTITDELKGVTKTSKKSKVSAGFKVDPRNSLSAAEAKEFGETDFVVYLVRKSESAENLLDLAKRHLSVEKNQEKTLIDGIMAQMKKEGGATAKLGKRSVSFVAVDLLEREMAGPYDESERAERAHKVGVKLAALMLHELGHAMGAEHDKGLMSPNLDLTIDKPDDDLHFTKKSKGQIIQKLEDL